MSIKRYLLCINVIFLFCGSLFAQAHIDITMITMEEAINRALKLNNQVKSSEYAMEKASWNTNHAWSRLFPVISFNTRYTWIDDSTLALRDFSRYFQDPDLPFKIPQTVFQNAFFTSLNLSMTVLNPSLFNRISQANIGEEIARDLNTSTRRTIMFQVIRTCLEVLKRKEIYENQLEYLELSRLNYEKAERLFKSGRYSKTESMRWKVDYQQQMSMVTTSESNLRSARIFLGRLLNAKAGEFFRVENRIPKYLLDESKKLINMSDQNLLALIQVDEAELIKLNTDLSAAKRNEDLSQTIYRNSYNNYLPIIDLSYTYAWRENNNIALDDYSPKTLMVNFSLPIFTSFQNYTQLQSSYFDYKQSQENFYDQLQNLRYVLTETVNKLVNLKMQNELSKISLEFNQRNYRIIEQQKESGLVSNIDFIDAKLNLQDANLTDVSNNYDFITGMVELYYLLGKLETIIE